MFFRLITGILLMLFSVAISAQEIACTALDNFENSEFADTPIVLTMNDPGPVNILDDGSPGVLGSIRDINFGPVTGSITNVVSFLSISGDRLTVSNTSQASAPVSVTYDASGSGLDISLLNAITMSLMLEVSDLEGSSANIIVTDSANNMANYLIPVLPSIVGGDDFPVAVDFPIAQFTGIESVDLSDIQSIELVIDTSAAEGSDVSISNVDICRAVFPSVAVPALSGWSLIAMISLLGIAGFIVLGRKNLITN